MRTPACTAAGIPLIGRSADFSHVYLSHQWAELPADHWFECDGYLNELEWHALPYTHDESYREWSFDDLDENYNPTFPTEAGARR